MLPHQIIEKMNDLVEGYEQLRREFPSPRILLNDLRKVNELITEIERRYGSIKKFLDELQQMRVKLEVLRKEATMASRDKHD